MTIQHLGAVSGTIIAPVQAYPAGSLTVGPETIPAGYSSILALIDLRQVDTLVGNISVEVEYSIGGNWEFVGGGGVNLSNPTYSLVNGVLTNDEGGPVRLVGILTEIPRTDINRQVRIKFSIDVPLIIGATLVGW